MNEPPRLHYLQHVPFEGPAEIAAWARKKGGPVTGTRLFAGDRLPPLDAFDLLVLMGGPMSVGDEAKYPWLKEEKAFLKKAVAAGKLVLGVCLGAQLAAEVLGGKIFPNEHREIGWFPVSLTPEGENSPRFRGLPKKFSAFHWHGDTFTIPPGARRTAFSEGCAAQALEAADGRVVGLQFHLESTPESVARLPANCAGDLEEKGPYIQTAEEMLAAAKTTQAESRRLLNTFLDAFTAQTAE